MADCEPPAQGCSSIPSGPPAFVSATTSCDEDMFRSSILHVQGARYTSGMERNPIADDIEAVPEVSTSDTLSAWPGVPVVGENRSHEIQHTSRWCNRINVREADGVCIVKGWWYAGKLRRW